MEMIETIHEILKKFKRLKHERKSRALLNDRPLGSLGSLGSLGLVTPLSPRLQRSCVNFVLSQFSTLLTLSLHQLLPKA